MSKARKRGGKQFLRSLSYVLYLAIALSAGSMMGWINRSKLLRETFNGLFVHQDPKAAFAGKSSVVLLLLGCDEDRYFRGTFLHGSPIQRQYARSDMMLLTRLDFDSHKITAISIPRDTKCAVPGYGRHKINAFFSIAPFSKTSTVPVLLQRAALTQKAVESLLPGVHVDQSVVLNFDAFQKLVDVVGGVEINVPEKMDYDDKAGDLHIHLNPGVQHLDGYNAMGYVRFRHDAESDFGRQGRQKDFMLAFKKGVLSNISRLPEVVEGGKKVLNGSLNDDQIRALFSFSRSVPQANIQMGMVPVIERPREIVLDKSKVDATLKQYGFVGGQPAPQTPTPSP